MPARQVRKGPGTSKYERVAQQAAAFVYISCFINARCQCAGTSSTSNIWSTVGSRDFSPVFGRLLGERGRRDCRRGGASGAARSQAGAWERGGAALVPRLCLGTQCCRGSASPVPASFHFWLRQCLRAIDDCQWNCSPAKRRRFCIFPFFAISVEAEPLRQCVPRQEPYLLPTSPTPLRPAFTQRGMGLTADENASAARGCDIGMSNDRHDR